MNDSEKWQANPRLIFELPCVPFSVCVLSALDGAQMDLKASLPQSQLQLLDSRQQQLVAMTKLQPFLWAVNDVTLAIDIQMTWRMTSTWMLQWNRSSGKWILRLQIPWRSSKCFFLFRLTASKPGDHGRNITVVRNKFLVMIIKFGSCLCSSSIAKLLLLVIQISYLANLV